MYHKHVGDSWMSCTMCRSQRLGKQVLQKARQRQVHWPKEKVSSTNLIEDPNVYTSIDDAFTSVLQYMSTTTRSCKRYYKSCSPESVAPVDDQHCGRFHTPRYTEAQRRHPLERTEDVHMVVHPGTYSVTAGEWGSQQHQTHVLKVRQGQTVEMDFVM